MYNNLFLRPVLHSNGTKTRDGFSYFDLGRWKYIWGGGGGGEVLFGFGMGHGTACKSHSFALWLVLGIKIGLRDKEDNVLTSPLQSVGICFIYIVYLLTTVPFSKVTSCPFCNFPKRGPLGTPNSSAFFTFIFPGTATSSQI